LKKKIASIVSYQILPYFSGGQKSIAQFNEFLGAQSDLTVFSTNSNDCNLVKNYTLLPWMKNGKLKFFQLSLYFKISSFIKANEIKYLIIEHPYMGWLGWLVKHSCNIPLIVHTHNIEYLRFKSVGKLWWPILMGYEKWVLNMADIVFCISEEDKQFMVNELSVRESKCHVITFGLPIPSVPTDKQLCADTVRKLHNINTNEAIILFNGQLNYGPNLNAVNDILNHINPLLLKSGLDYKIIICGKFLPEELNGLKEYADKNIIYAGMVPDIELYFKAADIFINPVLSGGGIKTKLVEALGYNTTVISAATGAIGCDREASGDKLVVIKDNDWAAFTEAIIEKLHQPITTPDSFYAKYYWGNITKKALDCLPI
jgi:glycosyltransferase involved in cell wall biosynthesis